MYLADLSRANFACFPLPTGPFSLPLPFPGLPPRLASYPHPTPSCLRAFITWTSDLSKALTVPVGQKSICEEWDQPKAPSSPKPHHQSAPKELHSSTSAVPPGWGRSLYSLQFLRRERESRVGERQTRGEGGIGRREKGRERQREAERLVPSPRCLFCCF